MAKRKTRVSPGGAAARLARWRWHRNPGGRLSPTLVKRLMEWRSPDYPAIKALAQSPHPATEAYAAIRDLMAQYERPDLKAADLQHLKKTLAMVEAETGVVNRSNPIHGAGAGPLYRLADGDVVTKAQLRRMFMGRIPGPTQRRLLGIEKVGKNPKRGRRVAASRKRQMARALHMMAVNEKSGSSRILPRLYRAERRLIRAGVPRRVWAKKLTKALRKSDARNRKNPKRGRRLAGARARILSRATLRARVNKASGGARNAVMRSILAQVLAGKIKIRGARISAAVKRGIRRGRR